MEWFSSPMLKKSSLQRHDPLSKMRGGHDTKEDFLIEKANKLRDALCEIPSLTVMLDEVHHTYGKQKKSASKDLKKLREAVEVINSSGRVNSVIGFSGTPYAENRLTIGSHVIKLNQIQDIVYDYPLNKGIGNFLKTPTIRKADVAERKFMEQALADFFADFDKEYENGTQSKIAFYCPSVASLNETILPIVQDWYGQHRKGKEGEIFKFYRNEGEYKLPKGSEAMYHNLDKPYSKVRVILLVAIGKEGWDCRSLTSVVLPRKVTAKNFVLQTTCRCLREVTDASQEKALIYLSPDNYKTLNQELHDNYRLKIKDLLGHSDEKMAVQVRKPQLGQLKYKQIEHRYRIASRVSPDIKKELAEFKFSAIKSRHSYDARTISGRIGAGGITGESEIPRKVRHDTRRFSYEDFLYKLSASLYGQWSESELFMKYGQELQNVYNDIEHKDNWLWLASHPHLNRHDVIEMVASLFVDEVKYTKDVIARETEIQLLEWTQDGDMSLYASEGVLHQFSPPIAKEDVRNYQRHPEDMEKDFFQRNNHDPSDSSYNYIPYRMDSRFEQNALAEILKVIGSYDLEVYFNGYKDERLESFWIQTPHGKYTPDFLVLKRTGKQKYTKDEKPAAIEKALIIETKGEPYYDESFRNKEKFIKQTFLQHNKHFGYHCFVDEGGNDFTRHLDDFKKLLKEL